MRRRILSGIARFAYQQPWRMTAAIAVVTGVLATFAFRLQVDFDWIAFLPNESKAVAAAQRIKRSYPTAFDTIIVALESAEPHQQRTLVDAAERMAEWFLSEPDLVADIEFRVDAETRHFFADLGESPLLALLDEQEWAAFEQELLSHNFDLPLVLARTRLQTPFIPGGAAEMDPLGLLERMQAALIPRFGPALLPQQGGYAISHDGRILVMAVKPTRSSSDVLFAHSVVRHLERSVKRVLKRETELRDEVFASFYGSHVDVTRTVQHVQGDLGYILIFGFLMMLLLFVVAFRKVEAIFYVSLPVIFGIVWTLGFAGLLYREVTVATMAFLIVVVALGLEFCLHIYNRFTHEVYRSRSYPGALETSFVQTGRGIWTSGAAGALVFAALGLAPHEGLSELGVVAAIGVLCGLASTLVVLPTMISFKARIRHERVNPVVLPPLGLDRLAGTVAGHPRATLVMGFLLTAYFAYWTLGLEYRQTPPPYSPPAKLNDKYYRDYPKDLPTPSNPIFAIARSPDLQVALLKNDRLYGNLREIREKYRLVSVDSLRDILPSIETQRAFRLRLKELDMEELTDALDDAGRRQGYGRNAFTPLLAVLNSAQALPDNDLFLTYDAEEAAPPALDRAVRRYLSWSAQDKDETGGRTFTVVTTIYPSPDSFGDDGLVPFLLEARQGIQGIEFTGEPLLSRELAPGFQQTLSRVGLAAIGIVFLVLTIHFHSPWKAVAVLAPAGCVMVWVFGVLVLLDIHLHFYTLIILPLAMIFAMDHNLHFLQRYDERRDMWPALAVAGRAMLTTALAIMVGFGPLAFAKYEGLRHLGLTILFGNGLALLGSTTLLPAAIRLRELGTGLSGALDVDEGLGRELEDL